MTKSESENFSKALAFAAEKHAGQLRREGSPYIYHVIRVAMYLCGQGYDADCQIAGLFHDLLEDTDATVDELRQFCSEDAVAAIRLVTKTEGYDEEEYIKDILSNPMAKAIKNADRIDNLTDMTRQPDKEFIKRYIRNTEMFFYGRFSDELDKILDEARNCID